MSRVAARRPDALVLDIGLPDADGRDVCQALRAGGLDAPVLFLTARDTVADRIAGFRAGGDDYVTKPFSLAEVVVRLHALLRRAGVHSERLDASGLSMDPVGHEVSADGATVVLTPTEFRLLAALAARPGRTMRRIELARSAWPDGAVVHDNTLDVYVARLRKRLRAIPDAPQISTVHGVGYRLD
jgi:two-component system response regulator MprA